MQYINLHFTGTLTTFDISITLDSLSGRHNLNFDVWGIVVQLVGKYRF
jgi:hypothetical protein